MSQNLPKRSVRDFLSLRHPNHFVLAGANNRNVIITCRFLAVPVQAKAYSGTLTRREIVRANASLGELRRDKEKLSLPISCEFVRVKAS